MDADADGREDCQKRTLGPFELLGELGSGGMGVVYRARRRDLPQSLAIKVLRQPAERIAERFVREQEILARLDHPSIVRFLDSGQSPEGDAYYVMELVDGQPIDRFCAERGLGLRERIELFLEVCAAVSHAHQHLVVHRDLKPANVLVDREGRPRLLDFGISKWLDGGENGQETTRGATPMTLRYASPEQVRGVPVGVGTDVYSLTVLLFQLATGALPQPIELDFLDLAVAIDRQVPPLASRLLQERGDSVRARELAGDLDAILAKGLAKDPAERYPTVAALAADLRRFLEGQPVEARRRSPWRRAGYFLRRHRFAASVSAVFLLLLIATAAVLSWQTQVLAREKRNAQRAEARAEARADLLVKVFAEGDPLGSGPHATLLDALASVGFDIDRSLAAGDEAGSALAATAAEAYWRLGERRQAAALAEAALRAATPMPPQELAVLLGIALLAEPPPPPPDWSAFAARHAALRRAAAQRAELADCDLAEPLNRTLVQLHGPPVLRSLAVELQLECAVEAQAPEEARRALRLLEELRASLTDDHPAKRLLPQLRQRIEEAVRPPEETLP